MIEDIINNPSLFKSYLEKTKFSEEDYIEIRKICQRKLDEFENEYYDNKRYNQPK
jgi:tRNA-dihydrouridine synthase